MSIESGEFARELEIASRLARQAGKLALRYRDGDLKVELKSGDEPVTIADKKSSELIVDGLAKAFPDDIIISEENADDLRRRNAERVWYIDPIDGTKDFIRGEEGYCVMIGLAIEHRPSVGVVYQPNRETLFLAAPESGAWALQPESDPIRMRVSGIDDLGEVRLVASKSHRSTVIDEVKNALGISDELNIGSIGLKLAIIAVGDRDLYVNPSTKCSSWDTCAPEAILTEAGGVLSDIHGHLLHYDAEGTSHGRGLLASNGLLHPAAVERVAPLFANRELD